MLEVRLCKPAIYKLKILGRGKFEYYKSMGEVQKGRGTKFLKFSGGKQKAGGMIFYLNLVWGKTLEETIVIC